MKAIARIVHEGGTVTVTDETGETPLGDGVTRWGIDQAGRTVRVDLPFDVHDAVGAHVLCLGAAIDSATVLAVQEAPVAVAPLSPGIDLARLVRAGAGGRAPPALLHRAARGLIGAAERMAGVGTPRLWFGVDGVEVPLVTVAGTPRYPTRSIAYSTQLELAGLAPELVRGSQDIDEATVVYAIGVMLHGLAFGVLPWRAEEGGSPIATLQATLHGPREVVDAAEPLEALIVACTARARPERPTLSALAAAIDDRHADVDLRPIIAGLVGARWQNAIDIAEQLGVLDDDGAPQLTGRTVDLGPWRAWLARLPPPGVELPIPWPGTPTRHPF